MIQISESPLYELNPRIEDIALGGTVSLDLETTGVNSWESDIRVIAIRSNGTTWLLEPEQYSKEQLRLFFQQVADKLVIAHNAKFDLNFIYGKYGVLLSNVFCTMVASQIVGGGSKLNKHDLISCVKRYLNVDINVDKKELQKSFGGLGTLTREQLDYAAGDVEYLEPMREAILVPIKRNDLDKVLRLEMSLLPVLVKIETVGCLVDLTNWKKTLAEWEIVRTKLREELDVEYMKYSGTLFPNINYSSSKQLIEFIKRVDGKTPEKDSDGGGSKGSVDEDTLNNYMNENPDTKLSLFIEKLLEFREYEKLLSTYGDGFLAMTDSRGHIHTTYTQTSTSTGRLSSKNPNLQNIPSGKSGAGGIIRSFFVAPYKHKIITCDMTGAEVALAADLSGEPLLMDSLTQGVDMHSELASISFTIIAGHPVKISKSTEPIDINGVTIIPQEARDIHKSVTFSKFYKGGPKRVYQVLSRYINKLRPANERMEIAKRVSQALDDALPKLSRYLSRMIDKANDNGYLITTKLGRRRIFDSKVYGEAANAPIQGQNADAMKIAMVNIDRYLSKTGYGRIILTVHDEVVCEVKEAVAQEVGRVIEEEMAKALSWHLRNLQGKATVHIGEYWEK
jgi:DNA polymerase I